ncbi:PPC domain-containing DNA-binding protein [Natranaerobius trueperi]|uniref:DNA-binding protein n=1 Tax=Natranaerobius trueperi TaxID=759412 RepID=A0A226BXT5_9FIRM|nr:PPC domain-containing DNA-binding protein [Natranaerobius trueperi]OWZ83806.1 DNA-binding protein [Natranaerobius trueperi]
MQIKEFSKGRIFMGRLPKGKDLLSSIEEAARNQNVITGRVEVIGAVEKAVIGFYDKKERSYKSISLDKPLEIIQAVGNLSIKDNDVKAHVHVSLGDSEGYTYSGHLMEGTVIFASEIYIQEVVGPKLERTFDEPTGLPLWEI